MGIPFRAEKLGANMRADNLRSQEVLVSKGMGGFPVFASICITVFTESSDSGEHTSRWDYTIDGFVVDNSTFIKYVNA